MTIVIIGLAVIVALGLYGLYLIENQDKNK
jgi:hypothetical protein